MTEQRTLTNVLRFPKYLEPGSSPSKSIQWGEHRLNSPPDTDLIAHNQRLSITRFWGRDELYIQLQHPDHEQAAAYVVRSLHERREGQLLVLLSLPDMWPVKEHLSERYLLKIDQGVLETLSEADFLSLATEIDLAAPLCQSLVKTAFRFMFSSLTAGKSDRLRDYLLSKDPDKAASVNCGECNSSLHPEEDNCPACGVSRIAPTCVQCGQRVSKNKDESIRTSSVAGFDSWNCGWNGCCQCCGFQYASRLRVRTGHATANQDLSETMDLIIAGKIDPESKEMFAGTSHIDVSMGESLYEETDLWDYQPTIVIRIRRRVRGYAADHDCGALLAEEEIALTPEEWHAIREELDTKLNVLLARKPWSRDTT